MSEKLAIKKLTLQSFYSANSIFLKNRPSVPLMPQSKQVPKTVLTGAEISVDDGRRVANESEYGSRVGSPLRETRGRGGKTALQEGGMRLVEVMVSQEANMTRMVLYVFHGCKAVWLLRVWYLFGRAVFE